MRVYKDQRLAIIGTAIHTRYALGSVGCSLFFTTMPELVECLAHYLVASSIFEANPDADWGLQNLWVDGTEDEVGRAPTGSRLANRHVYILQPHSTIKRGNTNFQTPVWPTMCTSSSENGDTGMLTMSKSHLARLY